MKLSRAPIIFFSCLLLLSITHLSHAETKTFIKEYTYQASEDDSRNSSRVIALREVKRMLLEELGTYLESETEVKNFHLTKDQITTFSAGIVQTEIIEEKWDGRVYWLKSKIAADTDKVIESINDIRKDREKTKQLEGIKKKADELLRENERLRNELTAMKGGNRELKKFAYEKSIKELSSIEWLEKGYAARDHKSAINAYSRAIELDPKNAKAYYARARLSTKKLAFRDYYKLLEIEPRDSESYLIRAWTYKELKKNDLALQEFGKAIETASDLKEKAKAYSDRGRYYDAVTRDDQLALQDFSRAIELDPKDSWNYIHRGQSYLALERNDFAVRDFNKAIEIDPQNSAAYSARGYLFQREKPELAIIDFSKAIELYRDKSSLYYFPRAQAYERLGNLDLAIRDYSKILELEPDKTYIYNLRASLYAEAGRHDMALKDYTKTIELEPDLQSAYMDRAGYFAKYGKHVEAIKDYNGAIKLKPDFNAYAERGFSYFKLGKINLALKDYDKAIALNYGYPGKVYYYRAMLFSQEKNSIKAFQDLQKAMHADPYYKREAQKDPQFDSLRKNPDFIKLMTQ